MFNFLKNKFKNTDSEKPTTINETTQSSNYSSFPKPKKIRSTLLPVDKFEPEILPPILRKFVSDISYRLECPIDYVAVTAVVVFSSIIGTSCTIRPKKDDSWEIVPNLWGAVIGGPSMMKTPAMKAILVIIEHLQKKANKKHKEELKQYKLDEDSRDKENNHTTKKEPTLRIFKVNETSMQSQTILQSQNKRGILTFNDELMSLLSKLSKNENADYRAYYLEAWSGDSAYIDYKVGRGLTSAENICISLIGGIQPDLLLPFINKVYNGKNDGFIQRLQLAVYPDPMGEYKCIDKAPDNISKNKVFEIAEFLSVADFTKYGATVESDDDKPHINFSDDAQELFISWILDLKNNKIKNEKNKFIEEHLNKFPSLVPSLSLIFHLVEGADSQSFDKEIAIRHIQAAIKWSVYLESHARRIYSIGKPNYSSAKKLSDEICKLNNAKEISIREILRKNWTDLRSNEVIQKACDELVENNWLIPIASPPKNGRKPSPKYKINPRIHELSKE